MASLTQVYKELFSAPLQAVVAAENEYRAIWLSWFNQRIALAEAAGVTITADELAKIVAVAPVVKLNGVISTAIKLRIESTLNADAKVGLSLGSIPLTGSFGFSMQRTEESTLEASTAMTLTNADRDLESLLASNGLSGDKLSKEGITKVLKTSAGGSPEFLPGATSKAKER